MQTLLPSTNQPVARDNAETIQETLGKILKRIDTLIAILCGTRRLIRQIQFSCQLLPKLLETHPLLACGMCIFSSREGSHNWSNTEQSTALWCWPNPCPPMKWHNSWELCHSISTTHVLALWACWLQHYLTILNCGVSKVKTEKSQERPTFHHNEHKLPSPCLPGGGVIFYFYELICYFSDPCQLWSNYHYCYLLQQTLTNICTSHLGSLYCIYCTYSVYPNEKGFGM